MWILLVKTGKHAAQTACESVLFRPTQDRQPVFRTLRKSCKGHLGGPEEPASGQLCSSLPAPRPPHPIPPWGGGAPPPPPPACGLEPGPCECLPVPTGVPRQCSHLLQTPGSPTTHLGQFKFQPLPVLHLRSAWGLLVSRSALPGLSAGLYWPVHSWVSLKGQGGPHGHRHWKVPGGQHYSWSE